MARVGVTVIAVIITLCFFVIIPKGPLDAEIPPIISSGRSLVRLAPMKKHIAFLKVHKAASSTVQNLLFRFVIERDLSVVLPVSGNKFSEDTQHHNPIMPHPKDRKFDIFALHATFNKTMISKFLHNDTVYIGIVREPLDAMTSSAYYNRDVWKVGYLRKIPREDFIKQLIDHPDKYEPSQFSLTKNLMAADFGFPANLSRVHQSEIKSYLSFLASIFQLVMIVEHFDESLVLLRRYADWTIRDILYIPLNNNVHPKASKTLDKKTIKKFRERNFLDCALYDFFYERFLQQVSKQSDDFFQEVTYFKKVQRDAELFCLATSKGENHSRQYVQKSRWSDEFFIDKGDCDNMKVNELDFIQRLRQRHSSMFQI